MSTSSQTTARSATNALKSGLDAQSVIIPGESAEAFAQLRDEYYAQYTPTDPEQRFYLDTAITSEWDLRRFKRIEEQIWALAASRLEKPIPGLELGQALCQDDKILMRLHRRVAHARKTYQHAMDTFRRLQETGAQAQSASAAPASDSRLLSKLGSFRPDAYRGPSDPFLDAMKARFAQMHGTGGMEDDPDGLAPACQDADSPGEGAA